MSEEGLFRRARLRLAAKGAAIALGAALLVCGHAAVPPAPRARAESRYGTSQQGTSQQGTSQQGTSQQGTSQQGTSPGARRTAMERAAARARAPSPPVSGDPAAPGPQRGAPPPEPAAASERPRDQLEVSNEPLVPRELKIDTSGFDFDSQEPLIPEVQVLPPSDPLPPGATPRAPVTSEPLIPRAHEVGPDAGRR